MPADLLASLDGCGSLDQVLSLNQGGRGWILPADVEHYFLKLCLPLQSAVVREKIQLNVVSLKVACDDSQTSDEKPAVNLGVESPQKRVADLLRAGRVRSQADDSCYMTGMPPPVIVHRHVPGEGGKFLQGGGIERYPVGQLLRPNIPGDQVQYQLVNHLAENEAGFSEAVGTRKHLSDRP